MRKIIIFFIVIVVYVIGVAIYISSHRGQFKTSEVSQDGFNQKNEFPSLTGRIVAEPGIFSKPFLERLESQLANHEKVTSNQIAILAISSLGGEILEDFSIRVAEKWALGTKESDNGVLILLAVNDRKVRIEVGYGLEGILTDVYCNRVIRDIMIPEFKKGNMELGIEMGTNELIRVLEIGQPITEPSLWQKFRTFKGSGQQSFFHSLVGIFVILIIFLFAIIISFHSDAQSLWTFFFLLIFFQWLPPVFFGFWGWIICNAIYILGFAFVRLTRDRIEIIRKISRSISNNINYSEGSSGGSSSSGSSSSSGGGFRGGGGSFGGGGSSGDW